MIYTKITIAFFIYQTSSHQDLFLCDLCKFINSNLNISKYRNETMLSRT